MASSRYAVRRTRWTGRRDLIDDDATVDRPDEQENWPSDLVLTEFGDDPDRGGEYLIDISTEEKRAQAAARLKPIVATCADKGFAAVEFDILDS